MTIFQVESVVDMQAGTIYAEQYFPENSVNPIAQTSPIYISHSHAEQGVIKILNGAFINKI